jgi:hypothetical protein
MVGVVTVLQLVTLTEYVPVVEPAQLLAVTLIVYVPVVVPKVAVTVAAPLVGLIE